MSPDETSKGVNLATAWTELKTQPVHEIAAQLLSVAQEYYGEPMRDPELADILDQFELHILEIETLKISLSPADTTQSQKTTQLVFRICEGSRQCELEGPPLNQIATSQLQRAVTLHDRALRQLDRLGSTDARVAEWIKHICERRSSFAAELTHRSPTRQVTSLLDQLEQELAGLCSGISAWSKSGRPDHQQLAANVSRIRNFTEHAWCLTAVTDSIATDLLERVVQMHQRVAETICQLMPMDATLLAVNQEVRAQTDRFTSLLRRRKPN
jgi:hypothetical protein